MSQQDFLVRSVGSQIMKFIVKLNEDDSYFGNADGLLPLRHARESEGVRRPVSSASLCHRRLRVLGARNFSNLWSRASHINWHKCLRVLIASNIFGARLHLCMR